MPDWTARLKEVLLSGATPEKLALCVALGAVIGVFPVLGTSWLLCLLAGLALRLNPVLIQIVNQAAYPVYFALLVAFIRLGERLAGSKPAPLFAWAALSGLLDRPIELLQMFGMAGLHGVLGWAVAAPFATAALYYACLPVMRLLAARLAPRVR